MDWMPWVVQVSRMMRRKAIFENRLMECRVDCRTGAGCQSWPGPIPSPLVGFRVPGGHAALDFLGWDVFDVGADGPAEAEGIDDHRAALAPGVGGGRAQQFRAGGNGLGSERVTIRHVEVEAQRAAADGLRADGSPGGVFVAEHDDRIADLEFAVHHAAPGVGHAEAFDRVECVLIEHQRLIGTAEVQ